MSLKGKNIVVTGATSGLGVCIASALSKEGASVFIGGRRADRGAQVAKETNTTFHTVDVADEKSNEAFFAAAEKHFGGPQSIDYILLNAGVEGKSEETVVPNLSVDTCDYVFNVNVRGVVCGIKFGTPLLRKNGGFVLTSSSGSVVPFAGNPIYAASKAAVDSLVGSYASQFSQSDDDHLKTLSVVGINPTLYSSEMSDRFTGGGEGSVFVSKMFNVCQRPGKPEELASTLVDYLQGTLTQYKTGDSICCDADSHFPLNEYLERLAKATA